MDNFKYFKNKDINSYLKNASLFVFDLNGLIVDDEEVQLQAVNRAFEIKSLNIKLTEDYWINQCVGKRANVYLKKVIEESTGLTYKDSSQDLVSELAEIKNRIYGESIKEKVRNIVRPGILEFLNYLNYFLKDGSGGSGLKIALATSALKDEADIIIGDKGLNIKDYFDLILTGSDIINPKPDPEIYLKIAELLNISPDRGVVFEDSSYGVDSAKKAGYRVVAVPNRFTANQDLKQADLIINSFSRDARII